MMKKLFYSFAASLMLCACSPQAYVLNLDVRHPSTSGMDLDGKSMSVVYVRSEQPIDTLFCDNLAEGLAQGLEKEYFDSASEIGMFSVPDAEGALYSSKDSLINLVMTLGSDVVCLVDLPEFMGGSDKLDCLAKVYVYDSMNPKDRVERLTLRSKVTPDSLPGSTFTSEVFRMGKKMAEPLINTWKTEPFVFIYYDTFDARWVDAIEHASEGRWAEAMTLWMNLAESNTGTKLSAAAYDMALACYATREFDLALEWLALSDRTQPTSLNASLRERIKARME